MRRACFHENMLSGRGKGAVFREIAFFIARANKTRALSFVRELRAKRSSSATCRAHSRWFPAMSITASAAGPSATT
jgi:hypothetical protein